MFRLHEKIYPFNVCLVSYYYVMPARTSARTLCCLYSTGHLGGQPTTANEHHLSPLKFVDSVPNEVWHVRRCVKENSFGMRSIKKSFFCELKRDSDFQTPQEISIVMLSPNRT